MKYQKTYFANKKAIDSLGTFRDLIESFFLIKDPHEQSFDPQDEEEKYTRERQEINKSMVSIQRIIDDTGVPSFVGRHNTRVYLLPNIFDLKRYQVDKAEVFDLIDKVIGAYEDDKVRSLLRTFNLLQLLRFALEIPWNVISATGYEPTEKVKKGSSSLALMLLIYVALKHFGSYLYK